MGKSWELKKLWHVEVWFWGKFGRNVTICVDLHWVSFAFIITFWLFPDEHDFSGCFFRNIFLTFLIFYRFSKFLKILKVQPSVILRFRDIIAPLLYPPKRPAYQNSWCWILRLACGPPHICVINLYLFTVFFF